MPKISRVSSALPVAMIVSAGLLAGCTGTSTYGTGVTQEAQLLKDITGIVSLGRSDKPKIDYSSRPGLVKAPAQTAELPPPAETIESDNAYFPQNPEEVRAARLAGSKKPFTRRDGGIEYTIPEEVEGEVASSETQQNLNYGRAADGTGDREPSAAEMARASTENREQRLRRMRELSSNGAIGSAPRRYLTQPKAEYRTPAPTAPVGNPGEYEYGKKERKPIFGGIFKREKNSPNS